MSVAPITFTEAFDLVVAEAGADYVCRRRPCLDGHRHFYQWAGEADCIIGRTLFKLGFTAAQLAKMDRMGVAYDVMTKLNIGTVEERHAAGAAQSLQDRGKTWGVAQAEYHQVLDAYLGGRGA